MTEGPKKTKLSPLFNTITNEEFIKEYGKIREELTIEDLRTKATFGKYKGKTLLWIFTSVSVFQPLLIKNIWHRFKDNISIEDLRFKAKDKDFKGLLYYGYLL